MNAEQKHFLTVLLTKGDYEVLAKAYPFAAVLGSIGYIAFYFTDTAIGMAENIYLRVIVTVLFFQLFFLAAKITTVSKILIESIFSISLPLFFSYFFFATDQSINWQVGCIFCGFTYGTLTGKIINVFTIYPLFCILGFFFYDIYYKKTDLDYFFKGADVLIASNISAILASTIKLFFNSFLMATIKRDHEQKELISQMRLRTSTDENDRLKNNLNKIRKLTVIAKLSDVLIVHFNNLMNSIRSQTLLLDANYDFDPQKQKRSRTVLGITDKSISLIGQMSVLAQDSDLRTEPVDIHAVLTETIHVLIGTVSNFNAFDTKFDAEVCTVYGDPSLLQNSFYNIMLNGIQAMSSGGELRIGTRNTESVAGCNNGETSRKNILITISDDGVGIDDSVKNRIFEPFFTTKKNRNGIGMGLAMVHGTIQLHGGSIRVESAPGKGTTFSIELACI